MSTQSVKMGNKNRRGWFVAALLVIFLLVAAVVWYIGTAAAPGTALNGAQAHTPAEVWAAQGIDDYQYTLQVSCFCMVDATRPVTITVQNGQVASITYVDDGTAADPALFEQYDTIDEIFAVIDEAAAQEPARLDVTYDEATGVPQSIAIDISEQMADEELYLEISDFEALAETAELPAATSEPVVEAVGPPIIEKVSVEQCATPSAGTHQLIYAAQGVCFLYPDNYDVLQNDDGSLTIYERSWLNTEAPFASISFEPLNERDNIIAEYLPEVNLAVVTLPTVDLGGLTATVLDDLPGQDTNRRILAIEDDRVINIMIARIGADYGAVGEAAEVLSQMITESLQLIGIEPEAPFLAGPECPEPVTGTTLFTNAADGYCLLLPDGYAVDDSLTSNAGGGETAVYVDSIMNSSHARLFITVDDAQGRTLEEITAAKEAEISEIQGTPAMWSFGDVPDGVWSNQFDQVPGQDLSRQVLMVKDGRLYTLSFIPDDPTAGDVYAEMQTLYDTVMDSFSFLRQ